MRSAQVFDVGVDDGEQHLTLAFGDRDDAAAGVEVGADEIDFRVAWLALCAETESVTGKREVRRR